MPLMCSLVIVSVEGKRGGAGAGRAEAAAAERLHEVVIGSGGATWEQELLSRYGGTCRSFLVASGGLFPSALALAIVLCCCFEHASRLCCVAAWTARVSARQFGRPEMHDDRVMCAFVPLHEAHLVVGERVGSVFVDAPVEWRRGMHRNPVESALGTRGRHNGDDSGAMNSWSSNTAAKGPFTTMLKSPPT